MIYTGDADKLHEEILALCEESDDESEDDYTFYGYAEDAIDYADISLLYDGEHIHSKAGSRGIVDDWHNAFEAQ